MKKDEIIQKLFTGLTQDGRITTAFKTGMEYLAKLNVEPINPIQTFGLPETALAVATGNVNK